MNNNTEEGELHFIEATRKLRPHGPGCAAEGPVVNGFMNVVDL